MSVSRYYTMEKQNIDIRGARVNNLKNVDVTLPRNNFIVITGLSGSGKSSLAFDTLYAEGQRRYVESLSAYARQFLGRMAKPEVDKISGLPPAIAIEQKVNTRNPRSTVGTATEIYDYLRMLFARVGCTISPISGNEVKKHSVDDVVSAITALPQGTRFAVTAPIIMPQLRSFRSQIDIYLKEGFTRLVSSEGCIVNLSSLKNDDPIFDADSKSYSLLIDRLTVNIDKDTLSRLADSVETAFYEGHDTMSVLIFNGNSIARRLDFSKRFEADGISFIEPSDQMFNFNNPYGACPRCEGFGKTLGIDERLVVPNRTLSVYEDAIVCWRGEKMSQWKKDLIAVAAKNDFPIHTPYESLTERQKDFLWHGNESFGGIDGFFRMVESNAVKIQFRVMAARYRGKTLCPVCHGSRLRPEVEYVKVGNKSITELVSMSVDDLLYFFKYLNLSRHQKIIAERLIVEIKNRLQFLSDVGLGYLTLDRLSNTLSGGESQRINLATSLGSSLMGSLYILDEPSIGLHSRDTARMISVLHRLRDVGNTVVVVEHDEDIMQAADYIVDVGPDAGRLGGEIVYQGKLSSDSQDISATAINTRSYTLRYLTGELSIPVPPVRRIWHDYLRVEDASEHNLKSITVDFPIGVITAVTGVSGSGKSTLVRDVLYRAVARHLGDTCEAPGAHRRLTGALSRISAVEFVDQNPIGRSSRSNPATYLKAYDEIRALFADQQSAKQLGFPASYFSFNTDGGRCEDCKGEGSITIEMQFMADITIPCESCHGKRFKRDVLGIKYRDQNINDILEMTVENAIEFFSKDNSAITRRIVRRLQPLMDVGLGYIKLGQSSSTLSGGENQRVKLAYYLSTEKPQPTLFIFDEPTTGLHFHDISKLLDSFNRLIDKGHTIIVIEHNLDVIKCADHVIDIGPDGGNAGGNVVAAGTPEQVAENESSFTGKYLKTKLNINNNEI